MRGLDRKIDLQSRTVTLDDHGQEVETWGPVATDRFASVRPVSGSERYTAQQFVAQQQTEFRIRWSMDVANLNPLDRVIYPAASDTDSPGLDSHIYDIIEVSELGRREALKIIAARRAEHQ